MDIYFISEEKACGAQGGCGNQGKAQRGVFAGGARTVNSEVCKWNGLKKRMAKGNQDA